MTLCWDLTKNFYAEGIPDEIIKCVKYSQKTLASEHSIIPRYVDLYRNKMAVYLEVTKNEVLLRDLIGNRTLMHTIGSNIII